MYLGIYCCSVCTSIHGIHFPLALFLLALLYGILSPLHSSTPSSGILPSGTLVWHTLTWPSYRRYTQWTACPSVCLSVPKLSLLCPREYFPPSFPPSPTPSHPPYLSPSNIKLPLPFYGYQVALRGTPLTYTKSPTLHPSPLYLAFPLPYIAYLHHR